MFKILLAAIGVLIGLSTDGFLAAAVSGAIGFVIGFFADRRQQRSELEDKVALLESQLSALAKTVDALKLRVSSMSATSAAAPIEAPVVMPMEAPVAASITTPVAPADTAAPRSPEAAFDALVAQSLPEPAVPAIPPAQVAPPPAPAVSVTMPAATPVPSLRVDVPPAPAVTPTTAARDPAAPTPHPAPPAPPSTGGFNPIEAAWKWLFGGNTLVRVGVVVLFFGLAFLVKFAAEHAVIPVEFRYVGIGIGAIVAMVIGWRLREKRPGYAMAMQGLSVAALYLTVFAAFRLHGLLPGGLTMALLVGVCAFSAALAILQNARSMAVIGICGGFLAPVLASTGGGNHVALFSYFALLNLGILAIAWFKAWRPLNVLGFFFTFGIGSAWGQRYYRDELFASTEPFLILFFLFYLAIALLYARRRQSEMSSHGAVTIAGERVDYVDGSLVFGVPIAAYGLQYLMVRDMHLGTALSALALGAIYLPLATWLARRGRDDMKMMVESFLALGLVFASLAIPLALDAQWTAAAWALEGVGIYWVSMRQGRGWTRAFALLLQIGGGVNLLRALSIPGSESPVFGWETMMDGPAMSAAMVGIAGLGIAHIVRRYHDLASETERSLRPYFVLWGMAFLHLIFPLVLDQRWTGVAWAISGGAAVVIGLARTEWSAVAFGALLQLLGGVLFGTEDYSLSLRPVLNDHWLGCMLIAVAGVTSAVAMRRTIDRQRDEDKLASAADFMRAFVVGALFWSLFWWWTGGAFEIDLHAQVYALNAEIGLAALSAGVLLAIARWLRVGEARAIALLLLPALGMYAFQALDTLPHPAALLGWLAWPAALGMLGLVLRNNEDGPLASAIEWAHAIALWLVTGLATWQTWWWFSELGEPESAWPILGWALAPLAVFAMLGLLGKRALWPMSRFAQAYRYAAMPIAAGLWIWVFFANLASRGDAAPLPYLPIVNPLDLAVAATLLTLFLWTQRTLASLGRTSEGSRQSMAIALGATTFFWLNGVLLRTLHHWAGVPFDFDVMMESTLVQAALSLFWAVIALCLMLFSTRRGLRLFWLVGGALMALVVAKLFLVDLSRVGTVERIVSFIGVGILLLVLGYFSPVPPRRAEQS